MTAALEIMDNDLIAKLMTFFEEFSEESLGRLDEFYTQDIEFVDPVHRVAGILGMKRYLRQLAGSLTHYRIRYIDVLSGENSAYLTWEMEFAHPKLNGGRIQTVRGMSHLKFTHRIYYHEDSYDMGALLYEHLPLLGRITRGLKKRLAGRGH